jgi:predicted MFS family arabinose efflux permease
VFVDSWGWRAAFWMWIPLGIATVVLLLRTPEPARGEQDADLAAELAAGPMSSVDAAELAGLFRLPAPSRVGTFDYANHDWRSAFREISRIRSMWFGAVGITISQLLLAGLGFWGVPYLKEVHGLSASAAGGYFVTFGLGAAVGVLSGGYVADRLLVRGFVNARIYVVVVSSLIATALLVPAFASRNLSVTAPLFVLGGVFLTLPVAPADALLTDVVVAPLRGRAAAVRSVVRSAAGLAPLLIGGLKALTDLRTALLIFTPIYAVGGLTMLLAARHYPSDLAFVVAETRRIHEASSAADILVQGGQPPP